MNIRLRTLTLAIVLPLTLGAFAVGCDDDDDLEADRKGVGAECVANEDCLVEEGQSCLQDFKGGYCGVANCMGDVDCPEGSKCVAHDDGTNYCFRICLDKAECNRNRSVDNESNCSSSITFLDDEGGIKACVPPSN